MRTKSTPTIVNSAPLNPGEGYDGAGHASTPTYVTVPGGDFDELKRELLGLREDLLEVRASNDRSFRASLQGGWTAVATTEATTEATTSFSFASALPAAVLTVATTVGVPSAFA